VDTVKALTENLGARRETADVLYLHRNTLTHRIRRIEQLIGADLDDPEVLFGLYLAVKIRTYMK
jgi:purine catabolism regulator